MKWDLVIFDLDGTLIDTIEDLGTAVNHAMAEKGFPEHSMEEYKLMVGHGIRNLVFRALPAEVRDAEENAAATPIWDSALASFRSYYAAHIDVHTRPYAGIQELIQRLSTAGTAVAVASNKFQEGTEALVKEFFGGIRFSAVLGNRPDAPLKPDPAIVRTAIEGMGQTGDSAIRAIMVGDSATDIKTGRNSGIPSVGVTWGFRGRAELEGAGADYVVDTVSELESILL